MASSLPRNKREHSSLEPFLLDNLTRDQIEQFFDSSTLNDRQRLSWALQTESRVRLAKLEARDNTMDDDVSHTTLDCKYLFDIYPPDLGNNIHLKHKHNKEGTTTRKQGLYYVAPAQDRYDWDRKCQSTLKQIRDPDESFDSLPQLDMTGHEKHRNCLKRDEQKYKVSHNLYREAPVPPNFLCFKIILEAYLGYKWHSFHSTDPDKPRCAIQGGAVVAALTGWRDPEVLRLFEAAQLETWIDKRMQTMGDPDFQQYKDRLMRLVEDLHNWFQFKKPQQRWVAYDTWEDLPPEPQSPFSAGDADIFLQASPLTRSLTRKLNEFGIGPYIREKVEPFVGGCGFVQEDLKRLADSIFDKVQKNAEFKYVLGLDKEKYPEDVKMVFALTKNALSFMLTSEDDPEHEREEERLHGKLGRRMFWPRNTQLIRLSEKADLVGGLMDFDISLVACSFDGNSVRIAPRAAFSLVTLTQVVTPFVLEEKRNWQRVVKYYKRGFRAFVLDPNCRHDVQCVTGPFGPQAWKSTTDMTAGGPSDNSSQEEEATRPSSEDVVRFQREHDPVFCCGHSRLEYLYSFVLIEKAELEALQFFAHRDNWSETKKAEIQAVHPWLRVCCRDCRYEYENYSFVQRNPDFGEIIEGNVDELLHGQTSLRRQQERNIFSPSFYSGGVFDGRRNLLDPYFYDKALSKLDSQLQAEEARYFVKHSTYDGYTPRFTFGGDMDEVFKKASGISFPDSGRNPVGLNPERFVARCKSCQQWLLGSEFGTEYCELCENRKPSAKG